METLVTAFGNLDKSQARLKNKNVMMNLNVTANEIYHHQKML